MSADLLRLAAEKLRAKATAATAGSWCSLDGGDRLVSFGADSTSFGYVVDEPMSNSDNAAYIALMHPPVALALADWLRSAARDAEEIGPDPHALAVARAILREDA